METDADRLARFLIDHTPTISKSESSVSLDFGSPMEADDFLCMLGEMIEDACDARKAKADLEARLGMPWRQATAEQLREAGCVNIRDYIASPPEDEQSEIERQVAELKTQLGDPVDCSDIPEITDETRPVMARDRRDAEGRIIPEMRSTSG